VGDEVERCYLEIISNSSPLGRTAHWIAIQKTLASYLLSAADCRSVSNTFSQSIDLRVRV